jgi:hypothetical protein
MIKYGVLGENVTEAQLSLASGSPVVSTAQGVLGLSVEILGLVLVMAVSCIPSSPLSALRCLLSAICSLLSAL